MLYIQALIIGIVATALSIGAATLMGWPTNISYLELAAVATSYSCTFLCVKQSRWNYPVGVVTVGLYAYLFWQSSLLASMVLQLYLIPTLIYGWWRWGPDAKTRLVSFVERKWWPVYISITAITGYGSWAIAENLGGKLAPMDTFILIGSILAQYLLDQKKIETWIVWAIVNVVAIITYWNAELYLVAIQYVLFLANTVYGFIEWRKDISNHGFGRAAEQGV